MDIDRALRELKREADRTHLKDIVFTPQMAERVRARIRRESATLANRRRPAAWAMAVSFAVVAAAGVLYLQKPEPDRQQAAQPATDAASSDLLQTLPSPWQPSPLTETEYQGQTLRYYGEKPVRLIAEPWAAGHRQSVTFLLNEVEARQVQVTALSADGEWMDMGHHDVAGPLYDADAHVVLELSLPRQGVWKLRVLANGKVMGQVFVEVALSSTGVGDPALLEPISQHLRKHDDFASIGDRRCAAVYILGTESKRGETWVYAWGLVQSAKEGQQQGARAGISAPMVFQMAKTEGGLRVVAHRLPRDGSEYESSLRDMFPPPHLEQLRQIQSDPRQFNQMIEKLEQICEAQGATQQP